MNDLISIIVPIYNMENFLAKSLDSILNQTYEEFELLLIDDGSTDSSSSICDSYANNDERIKVVHQSNKGISGARNTGLKIAKGKYIMFIDPDDFISYDMIEKLYLNININKADISVCNYMCIYNDFKNKSLIPEGIYSNHDAIELLLKDDNMPSYLWNKLYRNVVWNNIYFPEGKRYEDTYVMHKVFMNANRISVIADALYMYVRHEASITFCTSRLNSWEMIEALESRKNDLKGTAFYDIACQTEMIKIRANLCELRLSQNQYDAYYNKLLNKLKEIYNMQKDKIKISSKIKFTVFFLFPDIFTKYYEKKHYNGF